MDVVPERLGTAQFFQQVIELDGAMDSPQHDDVVALERGQDRRDGILRFRQPALGRTRDDAVSAAGAVAILQAMTWLMPRDVSQRSHPQARPESIGWSQPDAPVCPVYPGRSPLRRAP